MPRKAKIPQELSQSIQKELSAVANKLQGQRKNLGWTQEQLAEKMECEVATVQAWEQKRRIPSLPTLMVLCRILRLKLYID